MTTAEYMTGAELCARALRDLEITTVFGVTGFPVTAILEQIIDLGIKYLGFRNEQSASYAASAYGYLTQKPACLIVVGGPGIVHALAGAINSSANHFPLLLLAGSCDTTSVGKGAFQELDAVALVSPHAKAALRPHSIYAIPQYITRAYRSAWYGNGTGFVDLPADLLQGNPSRIDATHLPAPIRSPPAAPAQDRTVMQISQLIRSASAPLIVIGKGSAYARAEDVLRKLIDSTQLPFLPTPMGKGVVPHSHPCCASSARSIALQKADVVLVLGAKLNWILHFGESPKWNPHARIIQVDIDPTVIGQNAGDAELSVVADLNTFLPQLFKYLQGWRYAENTPYRDALAKETAKHESSLAAAAQVISTPLKFEHAFHVVRSTLDALSPPSDGGIVYVAEGAATMDKSRQWFHPEHPRLRLDAGTHGTMGVGFGYMCAAWEAYNGPHAEGHSGKPGRKKVVGIMGDSATGFALAEIETMARYGMDCLMFVLNNGGVYHGSANSESEWTAQWQATKGNQGTAALRSWSLGWETRYDMFAEAVGGRGYLVRTSDELQHAAEEGYKARVPVIINVILESGKGSVAVFGFQQLEQKREKSESKL